ncbi:MAG: hypothetical protein M3417_05020 [Actinomycetota bacterium]|nr:hypothetical protein [Actinomycetota bacterium]
MSRTQRFGLFAVAAIVLIVAFLALRPEDAVTPTAATNTTSPPTTPAPSASGSTTSADPPAPEPSPGPLLEAGDIERLRVTKGERVRFRVRSKDTDELHVHGYEVKRELAAGEIVPVSFEAAIDGVFEIELEGAGEQIASLRVDP